MSIMKDSSVYLTGELLSKSIPFLLLPYLSRKLGLEGFGELSYYQIFLSLFVIIIGLSQDSAVARYFYAYGRRSLNLVVNTGYLYSISIGSVIILFCWIIKSEILFYLALTAIFQVFLSVQLSICQCHKEVITYIFIQIISTGVNALFTILLLEIYQDELVEKRILAILSSNVLAVLLTYFRYRKKITYKKFTISQYKIAFLYMMGFGLPMIFHHGSFFMKSQLDRVFIFHRFSEAELGLYSMGAQIAAVLSLLIMAMNKALVPYLFENLKTKKITLENLQRWAFISILIVPIPSLIMIITPEKWILFILGKHFLGVKYYIAIFLLSTSLSIPYLFLANYLFYFGRTKEISFCSILSTVIYLGSLGGLIFTDVIYVPLASIFGALGILPVLYKITRRGEKNEYAPH